MIHGMSRQLTLLIHVALAIILAGAIVTHYCGIQGELTLRTGEPAVGGFVKTSGPGQGRLPFSVSLESADIVFYPGTTTPMDFRSRLVIDGKTVTVSMNKVGQADGWRFYQSGISPDSSTMSVSYDPWGTGITYCGYALLLAGMAGFCLQRNTAWRSLLRGGRKTAAVLLLLAATDAGAAPAVEPPVMQRPLAASLGKVYVYWNDRVCPFQTMAYDVTKKLYGSDSYRGLTPEQVLSGWLFYFDAWERDYRNRRDKAGKEKDRAEREALVQWLGTGEAFRIYPYQTAGSYVEWLSLAGRRPSKMSLEQWKFMQTGMPGIKSLLLQGLNIEADHAIGQLRAGQLKYGGAANLPSEARMRAELFYNRCPGLFIPGMIALLAGAFCLYRGIKGRRGRRVTRIITAVAVWCMLIYVASMAGLSGWIGGHMPLSNGPELMLFMSFFALVCAVAVRRPMVRGAFLTVAAMTMFVAAMGGRTPRIGLLMPVLTSPLLSVHVMLVMTSYVFFLLMAILSGIGLTVRNTGTVAYLCRLNRIILVPSVFLLAAGIFVGAVWANQSWGRYWGWDPKETCALVMLLIYSVPVHWNSRALGAFRRPKVLHWYLLSAVLSVVFTYFGANYFLSGLHSYA